MDKSSISVRDFNTSLSGIGKSREKKSKGIEVFKNTVNQLDSIDIYRTHHQTTAGCLISKCIWNTNLDHETNINKLKIRIIQNLFSDHNGIKP